MKNKAQHSMFLIIILLSLLIGLSAAAAQTAAASLALPTITIPVNGTAQGAVRLACPLGCSAVTLTLQFDLSLARFVSASLGGYWGAGAALDVQRPHDAGGIVRLAARGTTLRDRDGTAFIIAFEGLRAGAGALVVSSLEISDQVGRTLTAQAVSSAINVLSADTPQVMLVEPVEARLGPSALYPALGQIRGGSALPLLGISDDGAWLFVGLRAFPDGSKPLLPTDNRVWIDALSPGLSFVGDLGLVRQVMPTDTPTFTPTNTPTLTPTPTDTPTPTPTPSPTSTPTDTPTLTFTPSNTPTPTLSEAEIAATQSAIDAATATAAAAPTRTQEALETVLAQRLTEVALSWTPTPSPTPTPTDTPTATPTPSPTPTPTDTPTITPTPTATPEPVFVTSGASNLRAGDGQNFAIVGTYPAGERSLVIGRSYRDPNWFFILLPNGTRAWVSRTVVQVVSGDPSLLPLVEPGTNRIFTLTPAPTRIPSPTRVTGIRCDNFAPILPINGFINGVQEFIWSPVEGIETYRVIIYDAADNVVWTQNVTGASAVDIDVSTGAIGPGISFSWKVVALVDGLPFCETYRVTAPRAPF